MSGYIWGFFGILLLALIWFVIGLASKSGRARSLEQELEEWEGVLDVRRKTRDKLNDPDYVERLQSTFNKKDD